MITNLNINEKYDLTTSAPETLGATFNNITVLGIFGFETAIAFPAGVDIINSHTNVIIENNTLEKDFRKCQFVLFKHDDGKQEFFSLDWIATAVATDAKDLNLKFTSISDAERVLITRAIEDIGLDQKMTIV